MYGPNGINYVFSPCRPLPKKNNEEGPKILAKRRREICFVRLRTGAGLESTADLLLVDFEGVAVGHVELEKALVMVRDEKLQNEKGDEAEEEENAEGRERRTVSGVSVGWTRVPSKRKRTELMDLP